MIALIFGPPGSGKGTQARVITEALGLRHLSTGEILRHEVAAGTPLGHEVERVMAAGDLVPDELMDQLVEARLAGGEPVLLDGFPRTLDQARDLERVVGLHHDFIEVVVALVVPERLLVDRLVKRAEVEGRSDDTRVVIEERMREYHRRTEPVLDHYRASGVPVLMVDGVGSIEEVSDRVRGALTDRQSSSSR
jgi:adenylate kinase